MSENPDPIWERFTRIESELSDLAEQFDTLKKITLDVMREVDALTNRQLREAPKLTSKIELRQIEDRMRKHAEKLSEITGRKA